MRAAWWRCCAHRRALARRSARRVANGASARFLSQHLAIYSLRTHAPRFIPRTTDAPRACIPSYLPFYSSSPRHTVQHKQPRCHSVPPAIARVGQYSPAPCLYCRTHYLRCVRLRLSNIFFKHLQTTRFADACEQASSLTPSPPAFLRALFLACAMYLVVLNISLQHAPPRCTIACHCCCSAMRLLHAWRSVARAPALFSPRTSSSCAFLLTRRAHAPSGYKHHYARYTPHAMPLLPLHTALSALHACASPPPIPCSFCGRFSSSLYSLLDTCLSYVPAAPHICCLFLLSYTHCTVCPLPSAHFLLPHTRTHCYNIFSIFILPPRALSSLLSPPAATPCLHHCLASPFTHIT